MNKRIIYKQPLQSTNYGSPIGEYEIHLPEGTKILKAGKDRNGDFCIWTEEPFTHDGNFKLRLFAIVGTGQKIANSSVEHIETFFDGPDVWHLYEKVLKES